MPYNNRRYPDGRRPGHPYLPPAISSPTETLEKSSMSSSNLVVTHTRQEYSVVVRPAEPAREVSEFKHHLSAMNTLLGPMLENYMFQDDRLKSLENQNQELTTDNTIVSSRMFELQREKDELETHYKNLMQQEREDAEAVKNELKSWRENAMRSTDQIETINVQLAEKQKIIDSQKEEIERLTKSFEGAQSTLDEAKKEVKGTKEMVSVLKKIVDDLEVENKRQNELDTETKERNNELKRMNEELQLQLKGVEADVRRQKKQLIFWTDSAEKAKADVARKEEKVQQQGAMIEKLSSERDVLKKKNDELNEKLKVELATKQKIFEEHMEFYTRPSLLNKLMKERLEKSNKGNGSVKVAKVEPSMQKSDKETLTRGDKS